MGIFDGLVSAVPDFLPLLAALAVTALVLWVANWILQRRRHQRGSDSRIPGQVILLLLTGVCVVLIVLALPVGDTSRGQLLALLGVGLTAVIALSSTTFVANAMAGLMLRAVKSFRPGDFIRVGEQFGRVTERGLFHTEIQTEDRDLTTLPNLYLVSNPVGVVRASGTIVSAKLSLGYDVGRATLEPLLQEAARKAELQDPFVQVTQLGDFSVTYRVAGFLPEVKHLLTARSTLRKRIMDTLHAAGIEIVSPTFMNQRQLKPETVVIPVGAEAAPPPAGTPEPEAPEALIFDKAEQAEEIEHLRAEQDQIAAEMKELESQLGDADEALRAQLQREIDCLRDRAETIATRLSAPRPDDD
ncbi:MAG: mechanosensitive ion channel family protein [Planctomycetota bacterium]|jgi:small-conductance mechanosensitive channel